MRRQIALMLVGLAVSLPLIGAVPSPLRVGPSALSVTGPGSSSPGIPKPRGKTAPFFDPSTQLFLPSLANGPNGAREHNYVTAVYIKNAGAAPASYVRIAYYDENGNPLPTGDSIANLAVNGGWTVRQDNGNSFAATQAGSGIITSDQPLAAFVKEIPATGDASSYTAIPSAATGATVFAPTIRNASATTFYFAEGYTGAGFTESLVLFTPDQSGVANIDLYALPGAIPSRFTLTLTAGVAAIFDVNQAVNQIVGANQQVSARVTLPGPGVVERILHFNTGSWYGSTDLVGVSQPSTEWDFAEGSTITAFNEYLTLLNPSGNLAVVTLNYFTDSGATASKSFTLAQNTRTTVEVFNGDLTNNSNCVPNGTGANCGVGPGIGGVAVQVKSTAPIVAERPMYVNNWDFGSGPVKDGHVAFGATAPGLTWNFAEGSTSTGFYEYLALLNPSATAATVKLKYMDTSGQSTEKILTVGASSRATVQVFNGDRNPGTCTPTGPTPNCGVGRGVAGVSVQVTSTSTPIVAERPMYMTFSNPGQGIGTVYGAHLALGSPALSRLFQFSAASTVSGESDYLTIQNPGSVAASILATYNIPGGQIVKTFTVGPTTRKTVEVFNPNEGAGSGFNPIGIVVSSDQPVMVEKAAYSSNATTYGASDTVGLIPPPFSYTTSLTFMNVGTGATDIALSYRDAAGTLVSTWTWTALNANSSRTLVSVGSLPLGFSGTATIQSTSTPAQPLAAIVNETGPGGQFASYDLVSGASTTLYAPVMLNNAYGGYVTALAVQNTSGTVGTVSVTYFNADGSTAKSVGNLPLPAFGALLLSQSDGVVGPMVNQVGYAAMLTSSVPIAAVVDESAPSSLGSSQQQTTAYNTSPAGTSAVNLPLVENAGPAGEWTGITIMNVGTGSVTVTVTYYAGATGASSSVTLASNGFSGIYQPTAGLAFGQRGTAVVTAGAGQVIVLCNEQTTGSLLTYSGM